MTDSLQKSISLEPAQLLQLVLDTIPQSVFWKNLNSVYLGCNRLFANDAGLESPDQIIGMTDFDMPWTKDEADFYRLCDRRVMDQNKAEVGIVEPQTNSLGEVVYLETNKVPLVDETGKVIGILGSYHDITKIKEAEQTLQRAHDLLEQRVKDRTKELRYLAERDTLTRLPNREFFTGQLEDVIANAVPFGMLFIDIDRFKMVNDSLGHGAGDQLLVQVARILENAVRDCDTVGRFGGDEFTVLIRNVQSDSQVVEISEKIQRSLARPIELGNSQYVISASIGILTDLNNTYKSSSDILRNSDIAMYEAKRAGKACHRSFTEEMLTQVSEKLELERRIRCGLANNEFVNAYQPIIDAKTGELRGFEALVRWQNEILGLISPDEFLPHAEETGLIVEIGEQVIRNVCAQLQEWRETHPQLSESISISVNLSKVQLLWEEFLVFLDAILAKHNLEPRHFKIEVTESMILDNHAMVKEVLQLLSDRGHTLMLDDFGTGYSSLSYLHLFPIDTLKIDRSFVHQINHNKSSQAIVKTVVGLADLLNMEVIAEGVEFKCEEEYLLDVGCHQMQGYRYAKPMKAAEASQFLKEYLHSSNANQLPLDGTYAASSPNSSCQS